MERRKSIVPITTLLALAAGRPPAAQDRRPVTIDDLMRLQRSLGCSSRPTQREWCTW
jgi:hypothetical protein